MSENSNINEIINEILELAKQGYRKSQIGRLIREKYGKDIKTLVGKNLEKILEENGIKEDIPEDLLNIFKKINRMLKHLEVHKKDTHTKKKLEEYEKSVQVIIKYYKRTGKLSKDFKYSRDIVKMYAT
ncbi:30S ribosomal protein S15 [Nanoarchaeota archaeon NZ13-N]|nr:MAG: 30S ribosomal protein S15 [Nanoarchaeota archaeon NZ13-N]